MSAIRQIEKKYNVKITREELDAIDEKGFIAFRVGGKLHFERIELLKFPYDFVSIDNRSSRDWRDEF
ncbi:MAG: hypothetical protein RBT63_10675 [Bdellovibrionales bacterium]|jgi:hypothetical protein|nr:hypothetical protein [Bdellovibrionales bacterium]